MGKGEIKHGRWIYLRGGLAMTGITAKDIEDAIQKLKEYNAPDPTTLYVDSDNLLEPAVEYLAACADVVVITRDGRRLGKRE